MKALEKDCTRRYESASAFAADIQRYLDDEPVLACPPSVGYRLRKYVRRHKGILTTASLVFVALLAGIGVTSWQAIQATNARRLADKQRQQASTNLQKALHAVDQMLIRVGDDRLAALPGAEAV